MEIKGICT